MAFLGYVFFRLDITCSWPQLFLYFFLVVNALIFLFAVMLIIATLSFWTAQSYGLARIFADLMKIGRYPLDIFVGFWRTIFLYFLPLVLIAQIPSQAILQGLSFQTVLFSFSLSGGFLFFALKFWKRGIRAYASAST